MDQTTEATEAPTAHRLPRKPLPSREAMGAMIAKHAKLGQLPMWGRYGVSFHVLKDDDDAAAYEPIIDGDEFIGYRRKDG